MGKVVNQKSAYNFPLNGYFQNPDTTSQGELLTWTGKKVFADKWTWRVDLLYIFTTCPGKERFAFFLGIFTALPIYLVKYLRTDGPERVDAMSVFSSC